MMSTWKLAPALAAGCSVVLKPDPQTPLTAIRLAELATEVGFPAGAINVVPGDGPTTGAYLVRHPGVDKIAFTGSTKTGGEIMRLASEPVKRVTLELGGKSPNLVFADADLASAMPSSAWAIYYAAGQSCEARSRLLVEKPLYDEVVSKMGELRRRGHASATRSTPRRRWARSSPTRHRDRVHGFVERGAGEGAEVVAGGAIPDGAGAFYPPTVVAGDERSRDRAGGGFRPGRDGDPVRGREGRDPARERRPLRADGDRVDGRSGARAPHRGAHQVGHGRDQHAVHGVPGDPVRRLQAVGLRARARRSRRSTSTSRRRASSSRPARGRSTRSGCRAARATGGRCSPPARRRRRAPRPSDRAAGARARRCARSTGSRSARSASCSPPLGRDDADAPRLGPRRRPLRRAGRPRASGSLGCGAVPRRSGVRAELRRARRPARARRRGGRERQLGERPGGDALVRARTSAGSRSACARRRFRSAGSSRRWRSRRSRTPAAPRRRSSSSPRSLRAGAARRRSSCAAREPGDGIEVGVGRADARATAALAAVGRQRALPLRADGGDRVRRALPPRRARLLRGSPPRSSSPASQVLARRSGSAAGAGRTVLRSRSCRCGGRARDRGGDASATAAARGRARSGCSCRRLSSRAGCRWPGTGSRSRPRPSSRARSEAARRSASSRPFSADRRRRAGRCSRRPCRARRGRRRSPSPRCPARRLVAAPLRI